MAVAAKVVSTQQTGTHKHLSGYENQSNIKITPTLPTVTATDLLSREKQQHVSFRLLTHVNLNDRAYSSFKIVSLRLRSVEDLNGVCATRHAHQRSVVEVLLQQKRR